jgi:hypothetical protein
MAKKLIVSCAFLLLLIQPYVLLAQDAGAQEKQATSESSAAISNDLLNQNVIAQDDWEPLKTIPVGDEITVETRAGKRIRGRLSKITDTTMIFVSSNQPVSLDQPEIKKIYRHIPGAGSRFINALKGAVIGTIIGAGLYGFALAIHRDFDGGALAQSIGYFAAFGAGMAALVKGTKKVLVYEAK